MRTTPVIGLLLGGNPPTVLGRIRTVIVDSVDGVPCARSFPHVRQEILERLPLSADVYSATSIVRVLVSSRVCAAPSHPNPNRVFRECCLTMGRIRSSRYRNYFTVQATATPGISTGDVIAHNRSTSPTRTKAQPSAFLEVSFYGETTKSLTGQVAAKSTHGDAF